MSTVAVLRARSENAGVHRLRLRPLFEARSDRAGRHPVELGGSGSHRGGMESARERCQ